MPKMSAGLIMYRMRGGKTPGEAGGEVKDKVEVLLVHPGGPFWKKKDARAWFIPKGELVEGEEPLVAAKREFAEETGMAPQAPLYSLGNVKQKSGKTIFAWAFEGDCDPACIKSNTFRLEWPPKSGHQQEFPEIDRAEFFPFERAKEKMHAGEFPLVERLLKMLQEK